MKKIFAMAASVLLFVSCSSDAVTEDDRQSVTKKGGDFFSEMDSRVKKDLLNFSDTADLVDVYEKITSLTPEDFETWIASTSKTNPINRDVEVDEKDEQKEGEVVDGKEYSEFFLSILNKNYKFVINGTTMWFNDGTIYELPQGYEDFSNEDLITKKEIFVVYGGMFNEEASQAKSAQTAPGIPNQNKSKGWTVGFPNNKRVNVTLFNETLFASNGGLLTSKMFVKYQKQYKSCSFWRCTWKEDKSGPFYSYVTGVTINSGAWSNLLSSSPIQMSTASVVTTQISQWKGVPFAMLNFQVGGSVMLSYQNTAKYCNLYWF